MSEESPGKENFKLPKELTEESPEKIAAAEAIKAEEAERAKQEADRITGLILEVVAGGDQEPAIKELTESADMTEPQAIAFVSGIIKFANELKETQAQENQKISEMMENYKRAYNVANEDIGTTNEKLRKSYNRNKLTVGALILSLIGNAILWYKIETGAGSDTSHEAAKPTKPIGSVTPLPTPQEIQTNMFVGPIYQRHEKPKPVKPPEPKPAPKEEEKEQAPIQNERYADLNSAIVNLESRYNDLDIMMRLNFDEGKAWDAHSGSGYYYQLKPGFDYDSSRAEFYGIVTGTTEGGKHKPGIEELRNALLARAKNIVRDSKALFADREAAAKLVVSLSLAGSMGYSGPGIYDVWNHTTQKPSEIYGIPTHTINEMTMIITTLNGFANGK